MTVANTSESLQRALTPVVVLSLLAASALHGYAVITELRALGFRHAQGGTIYPLLRTLEDDGLVTSAWDVSGSGPARKVFEITPTGSTRLDEDRAALRSVVDRLAHLGI